MFPVYKSGTAHVYVILGSSGAAAHRAREACKECPALGIGIGARNNHTEEQGAANIVNNRHCK
jgi:hypothetical protein